MKIAESARCSCSSTILAHANSTVPLTGSPIKLSRRRKYDPIEHFLFVGNAESEEQRERIDKEKGNRSRTKEKEGFTSRRVRTKRADGQRSSEHRKFRPRRDSHSNRLGNSPGSRDPGLTLDYQPLFKFHAAGTEIRAKSAEFLLDKTPKKFEAEETRRKMRAEETAAGVGKAKR